MQDSRTSAERAYDDLKSGAAWLKIQAITDDPTNDGRADDNEPEDTAAIIAILTEMDGGE